MNFTLASRFKEADFEIGESVEKRERVAKRRAFFIYFFVGVGGGGGLGGRGRMGDRHGEEVES